MSFYSDKQVMKMVLIASITFFILLFVTAMVIMGLRP